MLKEKQTKTKIQRSNAEIVTIPPRRKGRCSAAGAAAESRAEGILAAGTPAAGSQQGGIPEAGNPTAGRRPSGILPEDNLIIHNIIDNEKKLTTIIRQLVRKPD